MDTKISEENTAFSFSVEVKMEAAYSSETVVLYRSIRLREVVIQNTAGLMSTVFRVADLITIDMFIALIFLLFSGFCVCVFLIWFVRLLALRPLLAYCASLG
jgi:hypothetical protein